MKVGLLNFVIGLVALFAVGCSPLSSSSGTELGNGAGGCLAGVTSNGGPSAQLALFGTHVAAQSFLVAGSSVTLNSVSLNLQSFPTGSTTSVFPSPSLMTVGIYADSSASTTSTPLPTTPGALRGSGTFDVSAIPNTNAAPAFYTITFTSPITVNPTAIYWVVAILPLGSSTQYIGWQGSSGAVLQNQDSFYGTGAFPGPFSGTVNTTMSMDLQVGC